MIVKTKASADVGNSTTKIIVMDGVGKKARVQPTTIAYLPTIPRFEDDALDILVANLHKNIVVHVTSPAITQSGLFAIGDIAHVYDGLGFNIKHHKKAEHDFTIIQPLAMIAATTIQSMYKQSNELPGALEVRAEYTTAIPVVDYSKADAALLEKRLIGTHTLVVYVAEDLQVLVRINVTNAKVVQEGIPAFYALVGANASMFEVYNKRYGVNFSGQHFAARKMLFIDIGEGTTELIYIVDGMPVIAKSHGIRAGVGYVSQKALEGFKIKYKFNSFLSRSAFMKKVLDKKDKWHNEAKKELKLALYEQEEILFDAIKEGIENTLSNDVDDVVIFGGGANIFSNLEKKLIEYTNRYKMRVLWINGEESALLNAIGLDELNNKVFFKD